VAELTVDPDGVSSISSWHANGTKRPPHSKYVSTKQTRLRLAARLTHSEEKGKLIKSRVHFIAKR
jgi:hypothetical protein